MFWSFAYQGKRYITWGNPRTLPGISVTGLKARDDIQIYNGAHIQPNETAIWCNQCDYSLGVGDTMWLINYLRDVWRVKGRRRCGFKVVSGEPALRFYKKFLPKPFEMIQEHITEKEFMEAEHKLPTMYYWHDPVDNADRSWIDNRSIIRRVYAWSGMEYEGLADWGEFTNEEILYPPDSFWTDLGLDKNDKYVFFQWHTSVRSKNLPLRTNLKLIKHIVKQYGYKVYIIGHWKSLDALNDIDGVVNLAGKTSGSLESLFTLAFNSEFIVSPDSAGVHLGEAYKIPSVCLVSVLPPGYICHKYKIPAFMTGSVHCPYRPCGMIHSFPKAIKCPPGTGDHCKVFDDVNLDLFDSCVAKSFDNRTRYRSCPSEDFYQAQKQPISLHY